MCIRDRVKVDGLTCVGVPIGTPAFMRDWAGVKLRDQIQDLQKLRLMSDPLIHYREKSIWREIESGRDAGEGYKRRSCQE